MKKPLLERFQQLAGIKPLYSLDERKEGTNEQVVAAAAGFVAMVSAAGGMAALQMKMEDPGIREKHPKLATFLNLLDELGSAASQAKAGGVREQEDGEGTSDEEIAKIEDELESMFDIKDDCPTPGTDSNEEN